MVGISILIRLRMQESPLFVAAKKSGQISSHPLRDSFTKKYNFKFVLLALLGATMGQGVVWYTGQFYALSFIQNTLKVEVAQASQLIMWALLFATPFFIFFGWLSDRVGRKWIMLIGMLLAIVCYRPIYTAMYETGLAAGGGTIPAVLVLDPASFWKLVALVFVQVFFVTMVYGPIAAFLVELFPTAIRYTSMSLPYHIGNGIFGGLLPAIATYLSTKATAANEIALQKGLPMPYSQPYLEGLWYPIIIASISFVIGAFYIHATTQQSKKNA
jgi:MFS family permease